MGLVLSCGKCTGSGTESVITFSDKLVKRLADGIIDEEPEEYVEEMIEQNWMDHIKRIDDSHTLAYGLSKDSFNALVKQLELKFKQMADLDDSCNRQSVIACLDKNQDCPLNCSREATEFISCTDKLRLQQMKERMKKLKKGCYQKK